MPGICDSGPIDSISSCCAVFVRSLHGFVTIPPNPPVGRRDLEDARALRKRLVHVVNLLREQLRLIDGRVCGGLDDPEHHALVLRRRQFLLREHIERHDQHRDDRPEHQNDRPVPQRRRQDARVAASHAVEAPIDPAGEAALECRPRAAAVTPIIGDSVSATTPETMTAPASVNANSRNNAPVRPPWIPTGAYTAASVIVIAMIGPTSSRAASMRRLKRPLSFMQMPLDVLHHHDRIIDDKSDRENDGKQR